ncbi:MAG: ribose ABC transporter [Gammaproteobacteria bacterium]|nr:ribose ABC transporter [Gammaproteobacteria bacterium]
MLFGISPELPANLLQTLSLMGHADEIVICDANFPASSVAKSTHVGEVIQTGYKTTSRACSDILSLMPLDAFVESPARCMEVPGSHDRSPDVHQEVSTVLNSLPGNPWSLTPLDRFEFYDRARHTFCVIRTLERRAYGCFLFTKGVLTPDGELMTPEFANKV